MGLFDKIDEMFNDKDVPKSCGTCKNAKKDPHSKAYQCEKLGNCIVSPSMDMPCKGDWYEKGSFLADFFSGMGL